MSDNQLSDAPLDLLNTGRDELVEGRSPGRIVAQTDDAAGAQPAPPKPSQRCDTAQREFWRSPNC